MENGRQGPIIIFPFIYRPSGRLLSPLRWFPTLAVSLVPLFYGLPWEQTCVLCILMKTRQVWLSQRRECAHLILQTISPFLCSSSDFILHITLLIVTETVAILHFLWVDFLHFPQQVCLKISQKHFQVTFHTKMKKKKKNTRFYNYIIWIIIIVYIIKCIILICISKLYNYILCMKN